MVAVLDRASGGLSAKEAVTSLSYSSPWGDVSKGRGTTVCNLAAGTSLGNVILFAAQLDSGGEYQKLAKIKAHPASVLAIDFSEAPEGSEPEWLRTTSADFELRFWGIQGGGSGGAKGLKEKRPASELRDQLWHSQTCALGWAVMGLDVDSGDVVPSIDRTPDRSACVSPSAKGALDLFRFPCLRGAAAKGYVCHSPNVSSVRFSSGGHNVFAIGGVDLAVSVWRRHLAFPAELLPLLDAPRSALSLLEHEEERAEWEQPEFPASLEAPLFSFSKPFLDTIKAFNKTGFDGVDLETMESFDDLSAKADLPLNTVLGFRGGRSLSAAHFSATGGVVYAAASIGVVQDLDATQDGKDAKQRLFKGHEDQILCVAVDAARQRVATGEVGAVSRICIWRATDCEFETALEGGHSEGVGALAFFSCGAQGEERDLLVSVGVDQNHSIVVWDIAARAPLVRVWRNPKL
ncbi:hypothetical protein T484DRAFT_2426227 [Baffinella frigidus]|nr:hypothetical protein T484DRAFT_2426227 [Cryptophyta sp. CCMP2293]